MSLFKRLPVNELGRDFVIGDVHGCFDEVIAALRSVRFDRGRDRLLCVGDTVNRGPESHRALGFLAQPWVHAVRGNHETMILQMHADGREGVEAYMTSRNGMGWWRQVPGEERERFVAAFAALPIAIEVETEEEPVGIVHAEVPAGLTWGDFVSLLEQADEGVAYQAVCGRDRLRARDDTGVEGIGRVYVGHTPCARPLQLGNVFYIDTAAVYGVVEKDPKGRLTIADIRAPTAELVKTPDREDAREQDQPAGFGV